jgi:hypothetical protein
VPDRDLLPLLLLDEEPVADTAEDALDDPVRSL